MFGLIKTSDLAFLRRQAYVLLLAGGLAGLVALMAHDADAALTVAATPVAQTAPAMKALTSGSHMDGFSTWSPDGKRIAFMRDGRIWVIGENGAGAKPVTKPDGAWDASPAWQPDGKQIAFVRLLPDQERARVMMVDPAGGKETQVVEEPVPVGYLAWGPGDALFYTTPRSLIRIDSGGARRPVFTVQDDWELIAGGVTISRDGRQVVFGAGPHGSQGVEYDLWTVTLSDGQSEPKRLTRSGGIMPAVDHTGRYLAFRNPRTQTGIHIMDLSTHSSTRLLADEEHMMYFHPAFSPDGARLSLSQLRLEGGGRQGQGAKFISHLYVVPVSAPR